MSRTIIAELNKLADNYAGSAVLVNRGACRVGLQIVPVSQKPTEFTGEDVGILGLGWHTFRHTYRSLLDETGAPVGVQQKLMRYSNVRNRHERIRQFRATREAGCE